MMRVAPTPSPDAELRDACRRCCDGALPAVADALMRAAAGVRGDEGETMLDGCEFGELYLARDITRLASMGLQKDLTWAVGVYTNQQYLSTHTAIRRFEACANGEPARLLCEGVEDTGGSLFRDPRFTVEMIVKGLMEEFTSRMPRLLVSRIQRRREGGSPWQRCFGAQEEGGGLLGLHTLNCALDGVLVGAAMETADELDAKIKYKEGELRALQGLLAAMGGSNSQVERCEQELKDLRARRQALPS